MVYADLEYLLSVALLSTAMFGMGATLTAADFIKVARVPQAMVLMFLVQVIISPLIAIGIARMLDLPPEITVGMLFVAALPGGLFSNIITYFGNGHVALSVTATAIASVTCLVTTSLVLRVVGSTDLPAEFHMPTRVILTEIILYMITPLATGMVVRRVAVQHAVIAKYAIRLSMIFLTLFIIAAIFSGRIRALEHGWLPPLALTLFCYCCLWLCYGLGSLMRLSRNDQFTIGMECVVRNVQLGVLLKAIVFPPGTSDLIGDGILYSLLFYGGLCMVLAGGEAFCKRMQIGLMFGQARKSKLAEPAPPQNRD